MRSGRTRKPSSTSGMGVFCNCFRTLCQILTGRSILSDLAGNTYQSDIVGHVWTAGDNPVWRYIEEPTEGKVEGRCTAPAELLDRHTTSAGFACLVIVPHEENDGLYFAACVLEADEVCGGGCGDIRKAEVTKCGTLRHLEDEPVFPHDTGVVSHDCSRCEAWSSSVGIEQHDSKASPLKTVRELRSVWWPRGSRRSTEAALRATSRPVTSRKL